MDRLIALDVSSVAVGYAYGTDLHDLMTGSFRLGPQTAGGNPKLPLFPRLADLSARIPRLLHVANCRVAAIECPDNAKHHRYYTGGNHGTSLALGMAVGVVASACWQAKVSVVPWDAQLVRERTLGRGNAGKEDVQWYLATIHQLVLPLLPDDSVDHDACDAIAIWIAQSDQMAADAKKKEQVG